MLLKDTAPNAAALISCAAHLPPELSVASVGRLRRVNQQVKASTEDSALWTRLYQRDLAPLRGELCETVRGYVRVCAQDRLLRVVPMKHGTSITI